MEETEENFQPDTPPQDPSQGGNLKLSTITMEIQFNSMLYLENLFNFLPVNYKYKDAKPTELKKIKNFDVVFGENIIGLNYKKNIRGMNLGCFNNSISMYILNTNQHIYCRIFNSIIIVSGAKNINETLKFIQTYFVDLVNNINYYIRTEEYAKQIFDNVTCDYIKENNVRLIEKEKLEIKDFYTNMIKYDFNLNHKINRKVLCEHFVKDKDSIFCVTYDPNVSSTLNLRVYYEDPGDGKYKIKRRKDKNTITFLVYESGHVTLSGPCEELCKDIYDIFINETKLIGEDLIKN